MIGIALLALLTAFATPAAAAESAPVRSDRITATLIADTDAAAPGTPLHIALRLRIKPGWHTYWSNPGDAGAPPDLTLTLPPGVQAGPIAWPAPQRLPEGPLMTYGYTKEVVLPLVVTPNAEIAGPMTIQAMATWLVCEKICVPEEGAFTLTLPPGTPAPSAEAPLIAAALARVPRPSPFAAQVAPDGRLSLVGAGLSPASVKDAWFIPAASGVIDQPAPQPLTVEDGRVTLALHPAPGVPPATPLEGVVTLRDPGGQESSLQISATPVGTAAPAATPVPIAETILFALLGGLLLNLMPCVFPVLAMKAMALARLSGSGRSEVRRHAVFYTAGVLAAFLALGGALVGLRATGTVIGWGFQFQSPIFVAAMAWVLFAVGLNLSGVFVVRLGLAGAGQGLAARHGPSGSFFTGLLAVLVATPCTAPFMGVAIAAGLAAPVPLTLAVFLAMGLGLAAPYALLALAPGLARLLPRPGPWMDVLRNVLAFPMFGAVVWLLWVISLQAGPDGVLATAAGLLLLGFAAWALGLAQASGRRSSRRLAYAAAALAMLGAATLLPGVAAVPPLPRNDTAETFTPARLAALQAQGRPVFVNMTAAWCVTCLVNERIALATPAVQRAFADHDIAYLKGDWTRGDPVITAFLAEHARDGVPLYVLYPPGQEPAVLPQILTETDILARLAKLERGRF